MIYISSDIDKQFGGTVEITSDEPEKENTVLTIDPEAEEINMYTAEEIDKKVADIKAQIIQQTPLFANSLEELEESGDKDKVYVLPDGYIYAYSYVETVVDGGPSYINQLPIAKETAVGSTIFNEIGYKKDVRLSSSGSVTTSEGTGMIATGFIPASDGAIIRTVGFNYFEKIPMGAYVISYNSSGTKLKHIQWFPDTTEEGTFGLAYIEEFTLDSTNFGTGIAFIRISTSGEATPQIVTVNEEIKESESTIVREYAWANTGYAFIPADYENRIIELENQVTNLKLDNINIITEIQKNKTNSIGISEVFAPSPQIPADGSNNSDFNAETCTAEDIYNYLDEIMNNYPRYVTKEILGKDASGNHDWCRYTLCRKYYNAWMQTNYPMMYAWVNGSTIIYSISVSPRLGDNMYSTSYIGTIYGTVSATDHVNQTRTINNLIFTRDKTQDISPKLVYTENAYSPYFIGEYAGFKNIVYENSNEKPISYATISSYNADSITDSKGITYIRYPFGDRNELFEDIPAIVIGSNEHGRIIKTNGTGGDPVEPSIISARMFKDLCECKNADNVFLNLLKNNYKIIFCIINPYGLSSTEMSFNGYYNSNGINIDRNFDTPGWGNDNTSGLQGDYAGSENETQYFMNTIAESKAKIVCANHGLGNEINTSTGEAGCSGHCHWMLGRDNSKYTESLKSIGSIMSSNYNLSFSDYNQAPPELYGKTRSYIDWIGAEGGAVEMNSREGFILAGEGNLHTAKILEADYTLVLQFLYMIIKHA